MKHCFFARHVSFLFTDSGEEGRKSIIVLLTPFLIRVMMAFCTLQSNPEKDLGRILKPLLLVSDISKPSCGRIMGNFTSCCHEFSYKLIIWFVNMKALPNPFMKGLSPSCIGVSLTLVSQNGRPFICKKLSVISCGQQRIYPFRSLVWIVTV